MKTLALLLAVVTFDAYAATAIWTGQMKMATSVTGAPVFNCEYMYAGQRFWRAFSGSCPSSIEIE